MPNTEPFTIRLESRKAELIRIWAAETMRSTSDQVDTILTEALRASGRLIVSPPEINVPHTSADPTRL